MQKYCSYSVQNIAGKCHMWHHMKPHVARQGINPCRPRHITLCDVACGMVMWHKKVGGCKKLQDGFLTRKSSEPQNFAMGDEAAWPG